MFSMFIDVKRYVKFMVDNKIGPQQFLFLYLIKRKEKETIELYKSGFPTEDNSMIGAFLKQDLIDRGFLTHNIEKGNVMSAYEVTEKFNNLFIKDRHEAADEFWKLYPGFVNIGGNNVPLTNMDRYQFALKYAERIGYSIDEHKAVLEDLKFGVSKGLVRQNIDKFISSQMWEKLRELRLGQQQITTVTHNDQEF